MTRESTTQSRAPEPVRARPPAPFTVIVVTRNEEANLPECLDALLTQAEDVEVVVVDAASTDATAAIARDYAVRDSRVRVIACDRVVSVGEARNLGLDATGPERNVCFVSADAVPEPDWLTQAAFSLRSSDVVYGSQEHAPPALCLAACIRGLRYHHFEKRNLAPQAYASHVNAAFAPHAIEGYRFGTTPEESALDDLLLSRHAVERGLDIAYAPGMRVRHKDVADLAGEWRKIRREARGWGRLRRRLGARKDVLAWGAGLLLAAGVAFWMTSVLAALVAAAILVAPAARRVTLRAVRRYGFKHVAGATLLAPVFDVAFLVSYLEGSVKAS